MKLLAINKKLNSDEMLLPINFIVYLREGMIDLLIKSSMFYNFIVCKNASLMA